MGGQGSWGGKLAQVVEWYVDSSTRFGRVLHVEARSRRSVQITFVDGGVNQGSRCRSPSSGWENLNRRGRPAQVGHNRAEGERREREGEREGERGWRVMAKTLILASNKISELKLERDQVL